MENLNVKLHQLVTEACKYPVGSRERQKNLTKIIRLINSKLWRENAPYYEDALQQTWIYFCQNLCEAKTAKQAYDPNRASVITWLNNYLKRRLQDHYLRVQKEKATQASVRKFDDTGDSFDLVANIPAPPQPPTLLPELKKWLAADPENKLRKTYIQNHPEVNCQVLILRRLPPETPWKQLEKEFGISSKTLSSFYQRKCLLYLRKFAQSEGYLA